MMKPKMMISKM